MLVIPLLVAASGTAAAHGGESYGSGAGGFASGSMGGGWGLFGGGMGLWGLLWMVILVAVPLYVGYVLLDRRSDGTDERSLSLLRERYARDELSDDEFARRRKQLEGAE